MKWKKTENQQTEREPRPFFTFITIAAETCTANIPPTTTKPNPTGTCYASKDCTNLGGTAAGKCAQGLGVCCYFEKTCNQIITTNTTSFVNPNSPATETNNLHCRTTVDLIGNNICQLLLNFTKFELAQPNSDTGVCGTDFFRVSGSLNDGIIPQLCGLNTGQHMYVDVDPAGGNPVLSVDLGISAVARQWDIDVTQIPCDSVSRAPEGCRQYYTGTTDTIMSFNYKVPTADEITNEKVNLHLANLDYRVCIASQPNYCTIQWAPSTTNLYGFIMTELAAATAAAADIGVEAGIRDPFDTTNPCLDYVSVMGGSYTDSSGTTPTTKQRDRYCGMYFPTVESTSQPFQLHVKTDSLELPTDTSNIGFSLNYRMLPSC